VSRDLRLLIGGSPCTHWSIAQTKNRETEPSGIGWELFRNYVTALRRYQPDYFLYENNKSMAPAIREQITRELGVEPVLINSALVSAQSRQRLYWAGRRNPDGTYSQVAVEQPEDRGILLRDILESGLPLREKGYTLKANYTNAGAVNGVCGRHFPAPMAAEPVNVTADGKAQTLKAQYGKNSIANFCGYVSTYGATGVAEPIRIGTIESDAKNADFDSQQYRVYSPDGKSVTLCGQGGGVGAKTGLYATPVKPVRVCNINGGGQGNRIYSTDAKSCAVKAQGGGLGGHGQGLYAIPAGCDLIITDSSIRCQRRDKKHSTVQGSHVNFEDGKSQTLSVAHTPKVIEPSAGKEWPVYEVKDGQITIRGKQYPIKLADGLYIIRKLTVTECKRLQTVPDTYVFPVSDTQAYKMLGNGWTVDVIAHIMGHFEGITERPVEVLSMYDGMSCGHIALDKLGAHIVRYYATKIDKYAIQTTQHNFPDTIQLGDAFQVQNDGWTLPGHTMEGGTAAVADMVEPAQKTEPEKAAADKGTKLEIVPMTLREANAYVEQNHRHHGPVPGHKFSIGLSDGEQIVGVAIVGRPVSRHLDDGWTLEVNRLCTDGTKNACSMLYAAAWRAARAMGYKRLVTYILESENGASLRAAGWKCVGQAGGLRWTGARRPEVDLYPAQMKIRFEQVVKV